MRAGIPLTEYLRQLAFKLRFPAPTYSELSLLGIEKKSFVTASRKASDETNHPAVQHFNCHHEP